MPEVPPSSPNAEPEPDDQSFWLHASEPAARSVWENPEDDAYAELLAAPPPAPAP